MGLLTLPPSKASLKDQIRFLVGLAAHIQTLQQIYWERLRQVHNDLAAQEKGASACSGTE